MRALRTRSLMHSLSRVVLAATLALAVCAAPVLAQGEGGSSDDDFFGSDDDDLFGSDDEGFTDEFLEEQPAAEPEKQTVGQQVFFWAVEVPADVLVVRPMAFADTAVGLMLFTGVATPQIAGALVRAGVEAIRDREWYVDQGDVDQAWQQLVNDPFEYLALRPIGQLTED